MTSASILQVQGLNLDEKSVLAHQEVMAPSVPSPISPRARHGRGKHGGSIGRARAVSDVNAREFQISKALTWILRRGQGEKAEEDGIDIEFDKDGWADCGEVLKWQNLSNLKPTISDLQALIMSNPRQKFSLKLKPSSTDESLASSWLIRGIPNATAAADAPNPGTPITIQADNIPGVVIYGTSYATYPLILSSGSLKKMGGTAVQFSTSGPEDMRDSEVLIYIDVHKALEHDKNLQWWINETGTSVTVTEVKGAKGVPSRFWKKIVGRKGDVGLLWEEGEVVKEVPIGYRGRKEKGGKGLKGRKGGEKSRGAKGKGRSLNMGSDGDSLDDDDSH